MLYVICLYLQIPESENEWKDISQNFAEKWNFPNCLGALDGKHVAIQKPKNEGSAYYNYKGFHSIILLALVDANCNFLWVNVGSNGRNSDGGVFKESDLYQELDTGSLPIPQMTYLPNSHIKAPHVIVADDAFALKHYLLKPYPNRNLTPEQAVFNYRLSRARGVVENAFGLLAQRFRILRTTINLEPEKCDLVVLASCALHNFLNKFTIATNNETASLTGLSFSAANNATTNIALKVRNDFCTYFNTTGSVPWQQPYQLL